MIKHAPVLIRLKITHRVFVFLCIFLVSCERAIDFQPSNPEPKLVVEATIENNHYPMVYLTNSLNFFSRISTTELSNSFVRNAIVIITNGVNRDTLKEAEVDFGDGNYLYYYTSDSTKINSIQGEEGQTYELTIQVAGKEYTSSTTIPHLTKTLDSLYYEEWVDDEDSSKVALYGKFYDPPGFGNYSRYFTKVNGDNYFPGISSVFDDQVIDGKSYSVQIEQGINRNASIDFEEYSFFRRGDNVTVKYCNVDKAVFDFWRTMEYSYSSIGNPFSSPTKVIGNISNGALGYFGGYAVQYASIVLPE